MNINSYRVLGTMSGTSIDGIDMTLAITNGKVFENINNFYCKYNDNEKKILNEIINNYSNIDKKYSEEFITDLYIKCLKKFENNNQYDFIGFHGQTVLHNPSLGQSLQVGNVNKISKIMKKNIIYDFRSNDLKHNGQGAPISPIYHKYLIQKINLELPSIFFNIGGISNLSYWDGKILLGYDVGPGNVFLDNYMKKKLNSNFDNLGILASTGKVIENEVKKFFCDPYFKKSYPKSLDKNSFANFFLNFIKHDYNHKDAMATLTEITALSILKSCNEMPQKPNHIIVSGGGFKNKFLISRISALLKKPIYDLATFGIDPDFVESELIAFLSARRLNKLPITFPSTTGSQKPIIGGKILYYKKPL